MRDPRACANLSEKRAASRARGYYELMLKINLTPRPSGTENEHVKKFPSSPLWAMVFGAVLTLAAAASANATEIDGVDVSSADITQLLTAMHIALKPNDSTIPIVVGVKPATDMPAYAKQWYYAGIQEKDGTRTMHVWFSADLKGADLQRALEAGFLLALADGGYGGKAFKQLYNLSAAKDAQLPSDASNPFVNRQQLATKLVDMLQIGQ